MNVKCSSNPANNVISDHSCDNGLILNDIYVPVELIQNILCYVDAKTLLNCQLVCKNWNKIIRDYVWRRKAESTMACTFSPDTSIDWKVFHFICTKNLFGKNLVKNHSGEKGFKYWKVFNNDIYYGGWDRFGGIGSADNDLFGGIDNYHVRRNTDHEEESGRVCARNEGDYEDNNAEDDDIDIIFEDDTKSEKSIKLNNEAADDENEDEVESSTEDEDDVLDENDDDNQNENDLAKGIDNYGFTDEDSQSDCANENSIGTDDENESASGNESSDNEVGYGNSCRGWIVECPPNCAPLLPDEPPFKTKQNCFVTTYYDCYKMYVIDLIKKGFTEYILDHLQPPIEISEWFCGRLDCVSVYKLRVALINESGRRMKEYRFEDILQGEKNNIWHNVKHEFTDYGSGLRRIHFFHGGRQQQFIAQNHGSKMAGACVRIKLKT